MPRGPKGEKRPADLIGNGVSQPLWSITDLAAMVDAAAPKPGKRGPYKEK